MSDEELDPKELAEAEALARALEGKEPSEDAAPAPADALQAAALLRHGRGHSELGAERGETLLGELTRERFEVANQPSAASTPDNVVALEVKTRRRSLASVAAVSVMLACAAAVLLMIFRPQASLAPRGSTTASAPNNASVKLARELMPAATPALLSAQAKYVTGEPDSSTHFEAQMQSYRQAMFRALESAYPQKLSLLEGPAEACKR
jgi:hypothetical protein